VRCSTAANGSIEFLEALAEKVKKHQAANLLCNLKIAEYKLKAQGTAIDVHPVASVPAYCPLHHCLLELLFLFGCIKSLVVVRTDLEGCKSILETSKAVIDENDSIELPIQGVYFRVSAGLNKVIKIRARPMTQRHSLSHVMMVSAYQLPLPPRR
jgi:hypothetical protein